MLRLPLSIGYRPYLYDDKLPWLFKFLGLIFFFIAIYGIWNHHKTDSAWSFLALGWFCWTASFLLYLRFLWICIGGSATPRPPPFEDALTGPYDVAARFALPIAYTVLFIAISIYRKSTPSKPVKWFLLTAAFAFVDSLIFWFLFGYIMGLRFYPTHIDWLSPFQPSNDYFF